VGYEQKFLLLYWLFLILRAFDLRQILPFMLASDIEFSSAKPALCIFAAKTIKTPLKLPSNHYRIRATGGSTISFSFRSPATAIASSKNSLHAEI
jgi:hypothetical protein